MKKLNQILPLVIFSLSIFTFTSCDPVGSERSVKVNTAEEVKKEKMETPDVADASFKDGMTGKIFHNYLQIKMALVNGDVSGAQAGASELEEAFTDERKSLKSLAEQISEADDLEVQRTYFSQFTQQIEPLFKQNLAGGTIYKQHCPMAFDNTGANWFSDVEQVRNPYFGEKMLKCGKVTEVIN